MTKNTKHIILGCLVMVAIVILVMPLFETRRSVDIDASQLKPPPFPDQSVHVTVKDIEAHNQYKVDSPVTVSKEAGSIPAGLINVSSDNTAATATWLIQAGSFKSKVNAVRLVNKLRAGSYHAFMESTNNQTFRVYVGPHNKKADASLLAEHLNKDFKLDSIIINYKPFTL